MEKKVKIGLIGTGMVSQQYIKGCRGFDILDLVACSDIDLERAKTVARQWNIPKACSVEELLADPEIQIVINLTIPQAHVPVSEAVVEAGKHVYSEKPLAVTLEDGKRLLAAARKKGVLVGCAPDTFLGSGHQMCRKLIDEGAIGEPIAAVAFWAEYIMSGPPGRDFTFQPGCGPMLDMGSYYVTALIDLLGPVKRVTGTVRKIFPARLVTEGEYKGRHIPIEVPTYITGTLDFTAGPVGTIITSYDVYEGSGLPKIEVYGTKGLLSVADPNIHGGVVRLRRPGYDWEEIPVRHSNKLGRGVGVADMAYAITYSRPHRASGELAYHALEVMTAFERASTSGRHIEIESQVNRPVPLPPGLAEGQLDE